MPRFRWGALVGVVLVAAAVGALAFNVGVSHGLAIGAAAATAAPPAGTVGPVGPWMYGWYGYYRPWGFGFFGPLAFVLLWFVAARLLLWGGLHGRRWRERGSSDLPPAFEEWHRRAHERMTGSGAAATPGHS